MAVYTLSQTAGPSGSVFIYEGDPLIRVAGPVTLPVTLDFVDKPVYHVLIESTDNCGSFTNLTLIPTTLAPMTTPASGWTTKAYSPPTTQATTTQRITTIAPTTEYQAIDVRYLVERCFPTLDPTAASVLRVQIYATPTGSSSNQFEIKILKTVEGNDVLWEDWTGVNFYLPNRFERMLGEGTYSFMIRDKLSPSIIGTSGTSVLVCNTPAETTLPTTIAPSTTVSPDYNVSIRRESDASGRAALRILISQDGRMVNSPIDLSLRGTYYVQQNGEIGYSWQTLVPAGQNGWLVPLDVLDGAVVTTICMSNIRPDNYNGIKFINRSFC